VHFIAVALLASVQAMKQRKFPGLAPIVILFVEIGLYVVSFFARLGGAADVIPRENMKPQLGNIALPRKADRISQAESAIKHRSGADAGHGSKFYFDLLATNNGLKA